MGNSLNLFQVGKKRKLRTKQKGSLSGKDSTDIIGSKQLIGEREKPSKSSKAENNSRMSSKFCFENDEDKLCLKAADKDTIVGNNNHLGNQGRVEEATSPLSTEAKTFTSTQTCSTSRSSIQNPSPRCKESRSCDAVGSCSMKAMSHEPQNLNPIDHNIPSTLPTLWLPFKSPFRRPFFFASNKSITDGTFNGTIGGRNEDIPMAMAGACEKNGSYLKLEDDQQIPWIQPNSLDSQPGERKPSVMTSLDHGDIPILYQNPSDENLPRNLGNTSIIGDVNCCGILPPIFQNAVPEDKAVDKTTIRKDKVEDNNSKKQGMMRKSKSDLSLRRHQKEQRQQDHQRLNNKKQRGAHQASSPQARHTLFHRSNDRDRASSPPPTVRYINDRKVTIIDEELKVFVVDLLTPETCELVRRMTDNHVRQVKESGCNIATWRTLYTYTKRDLPCSEVKGLTSRVTDHIMASIIDIVGKIHGNEQGASKLHPRSWKEPHLLLYQKFENENPHTGVEMHYDGCDITWNCMLSKSSDYESGGTYIRALRKTVRLEQGQILVHPGELYHKGCDITSGERALIVCFMDGFDPQIVDPSSTQEDNEIFERNVRMY